MIGLPRNSCYCFSWHQTAINVVAAFAASEVNLGFIPKNRACYNGHRPGAASRAGLEHLILRQNHAQSPNENEPAAIGKTSNVVLGFLSNDGRARLELSNNSRIGPRCICFPPTTKPHSRRRGFFFGERGRSHKALGALRERFRGRARSANRRFVAKSKFATTGDRPRVPLPQRPCAGALRGPSSSRGHLFLVPGPEPFGCSGVIVISGSNRRKLWISDEAHCYG